MQRITHDAGPYTAAQLDTLGETLTQLERHFPPSIVHLFSQPRRDGDGVQWWTPLEGQPTPYAELNAKAQADLLARVAQRQQAIAQLAERLGARGDTQTAQALEGLTGSVVLEHLYSLNDEPVMIRWGALAPRPVAPPPAPPLSPPPPRPPVPVVPRRRWGWWLLGLLALLALLLWALWWWRALWWPTPTPAPLGNYACTPGAVAPDFVMILDTSGSMNLSQSATAQDEEWYGQVGDRLPADNPRRLRILAEPTRLTLAKQAFDETLAQLHPDIATRVLTFDGCQVIRDHGLFRADQRTDLLRLVDGLPAYQATPLAASLERAASQVDGRDKDAVVVMFVDGEDNCDRDVCAVAREIAQRQPRLRVNMVSLSENPLSRCVADATGGRVYAARDRQALAQGLQQATEEVARQPECAR